jgi:hypothetical protein
MSVCSPGTLLLCQNDMPTSLYKSITIVHNRITDLLVGDYDVIDIRRDDVCFVVSCISPDDETTQWLYLISSVVIGWSWYAKNRFDVVLP